MHRIWCGEFPWRGVARGSWRKGQRKANDRPRSKTPRTPSWWDGEKCKECTSVESYFCSNLARKAFCSCCCCCCCCCSISLLQSTHPPSAGFNKSRSARKYYTPETLATKKGERSGNKWGEERSSNPEPANTFDGFIGRKEFFIKNSESISINQCGCAGVSWNEKVRVSGQSERWEERCGLIAKEVKLARFCRASSIDRDRVGRTVRFDLWRPYQRATIGLGQ